MNKYYYQPMQCNQEHLVSEMTSITPISSVSSQVNTFYEYERANPRVNSKAQVQHNKRQKTPRCTEFKKKTLTK